MNINKKVALAFAGFLTLAGCESTEGHHDYSGHASVADGVKPYPLKKCLVMDEKLGKEPYVFVHNGQQIKLCCESCKEDFDKDPATYLKKLAKK